MKEETKKRLRNIVFLIIVGGCLLAVAFSGPAWLKYLAISAGIIFLVMVVLHLSSIPTIKAHEKHPNFFKEIQSVLHTTLTPLGFRESELPDSWFRSVKYSRGEQSIEFLNDTRDSIFELRFSSSTKTETVEGHITKADEFKNEAIEKLNKWLDEQGIK